MTDPLIQAIERSRALEIKIKNDKLDEMGEFLMQRSAQHAKFREALAVADAALERIQDNCNAVSMAYWAKVARDCMRKLLKDGE